MPKNSDFLNRPDVKAELRYRFSVDAESGRVFYRNPPNKGPRRCSGDEVVGYPDRYGYLQIVTMFYQKRAWLMKHRLVWFLHYNEWPEDQLDHVDGDKVNNAISNLRSCSRQKNSSYLNHMHKNNTSGYRGVYYEKKQRKWRARIKYHQKNIHLGLFNTPEEAHQAYLEAHAKLYPDDPSRDIYVQSVGKLQEAV